MRGWRQIHQSHIESFTSRATKAIKHMRLKANIRPNSMAEATNNEQVLPLTIFGAILPCTCTIHHSVQTGNHSHNYTFGASGTFALSWRPFVKQPVQFWVYANMKQVNRKIILPRALQAVVRSLPQASEIIITITLAGQQRFMSRSLLPPLPPTYTSILEAVL